MLDDIKAVYAQHCLLKKQAIDYPDVQNNLAQREFVFQDIFTALGVSKEEIDTMNK